MDKMMKLASQIAVVVFSVSSCCMCHAVKRLFCELRVSLNVHELDEEGTKGKEMERAFAKLMGIKSTPVPVVFISGRLVGSTNEIMSLHLGGDLVTLLRDVRVLWL